MLEVKDITVTYGPVVAVKNLSLKVQEKSITVLLGANGSGKTSTLLAIAGLNKISSGEIFLSGERIDTLNAYEIVKRGLTLCPDSKLIFQKMTVLENLKAGAYARKGDIKEDLEEIFKLFPRLKERTKQLAGTLSGGERQMLAIARALMSKPRFLMLDEPSMGLAPNLVKEIMKVIQAIRDAGVTILLVEQNAYSALKISDFAYVIQTGKIVLQGRSGDLLKDRRIIEGYLGG
ncbi:ABC transporter ATP-binding protein [Pseudothermotoga sp. U03pept]|uniref:ABC transporter ATP-binding protein n=1 Tax=Pseudothermotoga sp. U03pept TaxID=3447012 RepID=UPI003F100004